MPSRWASRWSTRSSPGSARTPGSSFRGTWRCNTWSPIAGPSDPRGGIEHRWNVLCSQLNRVEIVLSPLSPFLVALVPGRSHVVVTGVEFIEIVAILALGNFGYMRGPCLLVVDQPVIRTSFRFEAPVFMDARVDEYGRDGQEDQERDESGFHG